MPTSDLKTPWTDYPVASPDPAGDDIPDRGGDPHANIGGTSGLTPLWSNAPVPTPGGPESANSQSGLPGMPSRMSPSPAQPPMPPSLEDRSPGTIDER